MSIHLPRETALKILFDINENGAYSNISINRHLEASEMKELDRAFVTELVYGTLKWKLSIDWIIGQFSNVRVKKISPWILNIIRIGVYQLLYTDRIPESAACNESVNLAKRYGHKAAAGFVNGLLRSIVRSRDKITYPDPVEKPVEYLSVRYSHPEWLVKEWLEAFGMSFTEALLKSNNKPPELTVRLNTLRASKEEILSLFQEEGLKTRPGKFLEEAFVIENTASITRLESFRKGYFQVQDESSMLVGHILQPKAGELVVDVCSAPGGKATHIAQMMEDRGTVIARDIHEHKLKLIQDASARLGLQSIQVELSDAEKVDEKLVGKADRVLVDAPCSGLGILRRKPDIKWSRDLFVKQDIIRLQKKILAAAARYVKPGGSLVYSTCTIGKEENEDVYMEFLKEHPEFEGENIEGLLPDGLVKPTAEKGFIQLYPNVDGTDGFFISKMKKRG